MNLLVPDGEIILVPAEADLEVVIFDDKLGDCLCEPVSSLTNCLSVT
jgi:hypothetical protein